jgi:hypothetical protein
MSNKIDLAVEWLSELLQETDKFVVEILQLGEEHPCQFSLRTLERAKRKLGLIAIAVPSEKEEAQNNLAILKRASRFSEAPVDKGEVEELKAAVSSKSGRIRWAWGFPSDPELFKLSIAELQRQREYHLVEVEHLADLISRMARRQPAAVDQQPPAVEAQPAASRVRF